MKLTDMTKEKFVSGIYWIKDGEKYVEAKEFKENEIYFI
jgi:hypothetical protein